MIKFIKLCLMILMVLAPLTIYAHPGHGEHPANSILHYIATPTHLLPLLMLVGTVIFLLVRRNIKKIDSREVDK